MGYSPAQSGLVDTYVTILDLLAHANYTFEVEAVNGVSDLSRTQRLFAAVSIATGQAGKDCCQFVCRCGVKALVNCVGANGNAKLSWDAEDLGFFFHLKEAL